MSDKFSIYDVLSVLLPGILCIFLFSLLGSEIKCEFKLSLPTIFNTEVIQGFFILIASIIAGAMIHTSSMYLIKRCPFYSQVTGIYTPIAELFSGFPDLKFMIEVLNTNCKAIYGNPFMDENATYKSNEKQQEEFYSYIYYYLETKGKNRMPYAFQSFYFFFRNLFLLALLFIITLILTTLYMLIEFCYVPGNFAVYYTIALITLPIFLVLARWYRKQMVKKMFWVYFAVCEVEEGTEAEK